MSETSKSDMYEKHIKGLEQQFNSACIPVAIVNEDLEIMYCNSAMETSLYGKSLKDDIRRIMSKNDFLEAKKMIGAGESFLKEMLVYPGNMLTFTPIEHEGEYKFAWVMAVGKNSSANIKQKLEHNLRGIRYLIQSNYVKVVISGLLMTLDEMNKIFLRHHITSANILVSKAKGACHKILRTAKNFEDFTNTEPNNKLVYIWTDLKYLMDACSTTFTTEKLKFRYIVDVPNEMRMATTVVMCDKNHLESIIFNLMSNGYLHNNNPDKSLVVMGYEVDGFVHLEFIDNGENIEKDKREYLFQPYNNNNYNPDTGMGVGLAVAYRLARKMGGDITYLPREPAGNVFLLRIPICKIDIATNQWRLEDANIHEYLYDSYSSVYTGLSQVISQPTEDFGISKKITGKDTVINIFGDD